MKEAPPIFLGMVATPKFLPRFLVRILCFSVNAQCDFSRWRLVCVFGSFENWKLWIIGFLEIGGSDIVGGASGGGGKYVRGAPS